MTHQKLTAKPTFRDAIFSIVRNIPEGQTQTYKEVAVAAGYPKAYRAVGNLLNTNYDPTIPCHRVIRSDGKTGGYNRGSEAKKEILMREKSNVILALTGKKPSL